MADEARRLFRAMLALRETRGSRQFDIQIGDVTTNLVVTAGDIVGIRASKQIEPIGRILRRKGLISSDHYLDVLERISEALAEGEKVRFGEVAVGLGYAKAEDVTRCLAEQMRGLAARVFASEAPQWITRDVPADRDASRDVNIPVEAVFLDAVRWMDDARKDAIALADAKPQALRAIWDVGTIDTRFELEESEASFVRVALAGDKPVADLLAAGAPDAVDVHALLTAVVASGAVSLGPPGAARPAAKPAGRAIPPPLPAWATIDAAAAERARAMLGGKRGTASVPPSDSALDHGLRAERAFQRGRELFRTGDVAAALAPLESAAKLEPSSLEYALFVRWSRHFLGGEPLSEPLARDLERDARALLDTNPRHAFAHFVAGEALDALAQGDAARAHRMKALRFDKELFEGVKGRRVSALRGRRSYTSSSEIDVAPPAAAAPAVEPPSPAPLPEPVAPAAAPPPPARAETPKPRRRSVVPFVLGGALVVGLAIAALRLDRGSSPPAAAAITTSMPVQAPSPPSTTPDAAVTEDLVVDAGTVVATAAEVIVDASAAATSVTAAVDPRSGVLRLPKSAAGHRVFVDGRVFNPTTDRLSVPCGRREVKIGSQGAVRSIDVPCAGEIDVR